jgi:hypothetical protein
VTDPEEAAVLNVLVKGKMKQMKAEEDARSGMKEIESVGGREKGIQMGAGNNRTPGHFFWCRIRPAGSRAN